MGAVLALWIVLGPCIVAGVPASANDANEVQRSVNEFVEAVASAQCEAILNHLSHESLQDEKLAHAFAAKVAAYRTLVSTLESRQVPLPLLPPDLREFSSERIAANRATFAKAKVEVEKDSAVVRFEGGGPLERNGVALVRESGRWRISIRPLFHVQAVGFGGRLDGLVKEQKECADAATAVVDAIRDGRITDMKDAMHQFSLGIGKAYDNYLEVPATQPTTQGEKTTAVLLSRPESAMMIEPSVAFTAGAIRRFAVGQDVLAFVRDEKVGLWSLKERRPIGEYRVRGGKWHIENRQLLVSEDGVKIRLAMMGMSEGGTEELVVYDARKWTELASLDLGSSPFLNVIGFSRDGTALFCVTGREFIRVNALSGNREGKPVALGAMVGKLGYLEQTRTDLLGSRCVLLYDHGALAKDVNGNVAWTLNEPKASLHVMRQANVCVVCDLYDDVSRTVSGIDMTSGKVVFRIPTTQPSHNNYACVSRDGNRAIVMDGVRAAFVETFFPAGGVGFDCDFREGEVQFNCSGDIAVVLPPVKVFNRDADKNSVTLTRGSSRVVVYDCRTGKRLYEADMDREMQEGGHQ